jgi:hypothetical protein
MVDKTNTLNREDEAVDVPAALNIGMAEYKDYVQRVYFVNGKPQKKTQAAPDPAPLKRMMKGLNYILNAG